MAMGLTGRSAFAILGVPTLAALAVVTCGGSAAGSAGTFGNPSPAGRIAPPSPARLVSAPCGTGDPHHLCLGTRWVSYEDGNGAPVLSRNQALSNLATLNQIWSQCDIGFQMEEYDPVDPARYGLAFGPEAENQLDPIRARFNDGRTLLAVTTGPWSGVKNAWTSMPGSPPYGAVMEAGIVDYGDGIIYAHEFGHYLGLAHVPDPTDVMDPVIYTDSDRITGAQCASARRTAHALWSPMLR